MISEEKHELAGGDFDSEAFNAFWFSLSQRTGKDKAEL